METKIKNVVLALGAMLFIVSPGAPEKPGYPKPISGADLPSKTLGQNRQQRPPGDQERIGRLPDISGEWHSNIRIVFIIEQEGPRFRWRERDGDRWFPGTIREDGLTISKPVERGEMRTVTGRIVEFDREGRPIFIVWDDGVHFSRAPIGPPPERPEAPRPPVGPGRFPDQDRVERAMASLRQYHFRIEQGNGVIFDGIALRGADRRYYRIFTDGPEAAPMAEVFWSGEQAIGHKLDTDTWFRLISRPPIDHIEMALGLLKQSRLEPPVIEGPNWRLRTLPWKGEGPEDPLFRLKDNPEQFFDEFLKELLCCPDAQENRRRFVEAVRSLEGHAEFVVSREDYLIREMHIIVTSGPGGENLGFSAAFSPSPEPGPAFRGGVEIAPGPEIPEAALLLTITDFGGWMDVKTHSPWAQRSLDLIAKTDATAKQYEELYAKNSVWGTDSFMETAARSGKQVDYQKNHPVVLGAYYEDETGAMPQFMHNWFKSDPKYKSNSAYYFASGGYMRDYHHYGYEDTGLKYEWYFKFRGSTPATTKPGDRYYSARDWGYGYGRINENLNRMTFTEAIKQYYRYSEEGKRNAYLMLGFVTHLLQDSGHPDHAALVPHPASGYTDYQIMIDQKYCTVLSLEVGAVVLVGCYKTTPPWPWNLICPVTAGIATGVAYGICKGFADDGEVGYERLIGDSWDISKIQSTIDSTGILTAKDYDSYFKSLGDFSLSAMSKYPTLKHALGCESLTLPPAPTVPNLNPNIDLSDSSQTKPYYQYTNEIVPRIIGTVAGFLEYFYQIVNYPPYLERMAIVQWESEDTPRKFAYFKDDADHCVRFDAEWTQGATSRTLKNNVQTQKLSLDRPAYIFLLFGPSKIGPVEGGKKMGKIELKVKPKYPAPGIQAEETPTLTLAEDEDLGYYYWGSFQPKNCGKDPYILTFEVTAEDAGPHLASRTASGKDLDSKPATIAMADSTKASSYYPFSGYEPGADSNHEIWVEAFQWSLAVNPQSQSLTVTEGAKKEAEYVLEVRQRNWDCHWEEKYGPPSCAVTWTLQKNIKLTTAAGAETGEPKELGLKIDLYTRTIGKATLTATPISKRLKSATYEIYVDYSVAESPNPKTGTVTLTLQLL